MGTALRAFAHSTLVQASRILREIHTPAGIGSGPISWKESSMSSDSNGPGAPLREVRQRICAKIRLHFDNVLRHPIFVFFFGLGFTCLVGAWSAGGEMFLAIPALLFGWVLISSGWIWAPELSRVTKGVWIILSAIAIGGEGIALYLHFYVSGENLLASFKIEETTPQQMNIDYTIRNFGKQSALVSGIGLFEIVGLSQRDNPLTFCNEVSGRDLAVIQIGQNMMGRNSQVGDATLKKSIYVPAMVTVDGKRFDFENPLEIEATKTRIVSATFFLDATHTRDADTLVICPVISTLDAKNVADTAICPGASTRVSMMTYYFNTSTAFTHEQFQLLPHSTKPSCPANQ